MNDEIVTTRRESSGSAALRIPYAIPVRIPLWINAAFAVLILGGAITNLATGDRTLGAVLGLVALPMVLFSWWGLRTRVLCGPQGITYRYFRTTSIPVQEIAVLEIDHLRGRDGTLRPLVAVVRTDGTRVKLLPTLRSDRVKVEARLKDLADTLGIDRYR